MMSENKSIKIEVLPSGSENTAFEQREEGLTHSAYKTETEFYGALRDGDVKKLQYTMQAFLNDGLVVGRLSDDSLRQTQYFAVSCITMATRYAIEGGLDEKTAYNFSDKCIQFADKARTSEEILGFLTDKSLEITLLVKAAQEKKPYPAAIKKCLKYIDKNLHAKISLEDLSVCCHLSKDYLSSLFKKHLGTTPSKYVTREKLKASKELLNGKYTYSEIGYYFSFCSETYYISRFKREFGVTPKEYMDGLKY